MSAQLLLVDDEPGLREAVKEYLQESGFGVRVASNAREGWELIQQNIPDLVISDVMMPQVDGYQFLKQLRDDPRLTSLPVIFLTAKGMTGDRIQGYQAGVDAYLPKPFDPDELIAIINNLLEKRVTQTTVVGEDSENIEIAKLAHEIAKIKDLLSPRIGISQTPPPFAIDLTPREQSVLNLVAQGLMNKEIARKLETSVRNVEKYVSRLFSKTGTNSRTELVRFALEHGLAQ
ncbi:response regulator transcription factor [Cylindrospermopsis raciborskii LB2897]|jgi:DNA-binding NarL/FixJ family response regulator|uniref:response regulator transcription factor n=1 Tax=Cylindrospermopsis raciborskii TaxID=77022 RepID=UPI000778EC7C|nr:response regulator transcription factor [Cylindrospermopsis raciborskii]MBG0744406.1 response regulator transcription factor [Cylindrospermopsis raciborskii KL1]MCZ2202078.1 response regulator transcription factor [Cylindrospermopsis raciborskii PAMP2012]MCZ2207619.1 response regulator transcription factor [Cylindrospermopsis raciborskii PAMP2011]NLQ07784.1 response regulator transcription factor [Cylindrospermopsis raciborskii LB2897]